MPINPKFHTSGLITPGPWAFINNGPQLDENLHCPCARLNSFFYSSPDSPKALIADENCTICDGTGIIAVPFSDLDLSNVEDDINV